MELSSKSKVTELLSKYPFLKDVLISLDAQFKALDSPVMMKTLGRVATLGRVSLVTGVSLEKLMPAIADEVKKRTGETLIVKKDEAEQMTYTPEERIRILKGIIKDLHAGADRQALTRRFQELIRDVAPTEIAQMEQQLISEGMPEAEIKKLCDVHVDVFRSSLDKKVMPGMPAGHPVHTFMLENRQAEVFIAEVEHIEDLKVDRSRLEGLLDQIAVIDRHFLRKENQLFPVLEAKGISGPSKVMWALHDDIRAMIKDVRKKVREGTIIPLELKTLITMLRDMIYKEEHILFPMTLETLSDDDWAKVMSGEQEIGYAWIEPEKVWQPTSAATRVEMMAGKSGSLNLDTGQLTAEQVNLMLTHLPVDLSFVNENDEVIYYSNTEDRIFPRSPGIIGRKVQNCHPPKSVGMVEKILDEFKAGNKNTADFWIQMRGRFILIRYFAMRDHKGVYKGCLEVSQDVTDIRNLQGQKRLLDW
ncbi:MAG: DUF438 domain-containing protein [Nitrospirae bacterium]|nr:DUF438 domain-containing protein [Nitrospirota bacterium]